MEAKIDYFLATRPAFPWSESSIGLPALAVFGGALIGLTVWTYLRHPSATRKRVFIILALRLAALFVALLTAVRPSVGVQEDPKVPSHLVIGIDLSESMSIKDAFNNQTRIEAVRKTLERCEPTLEALRTEQNVTVTMYAVGSPEFAEPTSSYDPTAGAIGKRSDYGAYLNRTADRWQTERFVRAHVLIGDGADNGSAFNALTEAARWRAVAPIHTFAVGSKTTPPTAKDVAITAVSVDPQPVPIKNELTLKVMVNAFGFVGAKVPVIVKFHDEQVLVEERTLTKETNNELELKLKAPDKPGEVRVTVTLPAEKLPGDAAPANNTFETFFTVTKEGVRILLVDRLRTENAQLRAALAGEKRFDLAQVLRQGDDPGSPAERQLFDFDARAYDVIILGNVSRRQLEAIDPKLPERLRDAVLRKGIGLLMTAGDASFAGNPNRPLDNGWKGSALEDILPVSLTRFPTVPDALFTATDKRFQTVPTAPGLQYLLKVNGEQSPDTWDKLNTQTAGVPPTRLTGISKLGTLKPGATVYAVASDARDRVPAGAVGNQTQPPFLLVGWQTGDSNRGRVLAWAGLDTFLWKSFGRRATPPTRDGIELHAQFWRRLVLWLAHQEDDEGAAFARPEFRRLPINGKQSIRVGLRSTAGGDAVDPKFEVKVLAPNQTADQVAPLPVVTDGTGSKTLFEPKQAGEFTVQVSASGVDAAGKPLKGEATARFIAYPETSDELLRAAADYDFLEKVSRASNGKPLVLDDLPGFLKELQAQPVTTVKPKPRFLPDWRRNHSGGFLPGWLLTFVILLAVEWALRRLWGMV